jgi:hypothetical protein
MTVGVKHLAPLCCREIINGSMKFAGAAFLVVGAGLLWMFTIPLEDPGTGLLRVYSIPIPTPSPGFVKMCLAPPSMIGADFLRVVRSPLSLVGAEFFRVAEAPLLRVLAHVFRVFSLPRVFLGTRVLIVGWYTRCSHCRVSFKDGVMVSPPRVLIHPGRTIT